MGVRREILGLLFVKVCKSDAVGLQLEEDIDSPKIIYDPLVFR